MKKEENILSLSNLDICTPLTIIFKLNEKVFRFPTTILKIVKDVVFIEVITIQEKILNFSTSNLLVELLFDENEGKPISWKRCSLSIVRDKEGKAFYAVTTKRNGEYVNRRGSYRVSLGFNADVQIGMHSPIQSVIVRDMSITGISFVFNEEIAKPLGKDIHIVFSDINFNYHFILTGEIVRWEQLSENRFLYGCTLSKNYRNMDKYIGLKQREEISKVMFGSENKLEYDKYNKIKNYVR